MKNQEVVSTVGLTHIDVPVSAPSDSTGCSASHSGSGIPRDSGGNARRVANAGAFIACGLLVAWFSGCASPKPQARFDERAVFTDLSSNMPTAVTITNQLSPELLRPGNALFTLGPGDSVEIELLGNPASRVLTRVGLDGKIYFSLLPG